VRAGEVRHDLPDDATRVVGALLGAVAAGDVDQVISLMSEDVVLLSDGGPDARAARRPVEGRDRVARFMVNLAERWLGQVTVEPMGINGEPGMVMRLRGHDELFLAMSAQVCDGRAVALHFVRNPEKLAALALEPIG
jgi:RNA polymerase sigma-70 factor (ECF subfamily)